ncbi:SAV_915 family protein [Streptomyces sp. P17]|uniref:SAV_915 family protein n=1 Tax=Streptomyces sp. P17 TaxID=3074716 RepID=UPI0028F4426C|nr:SAV_915 family protein [Streptomyces sp. P17]MDT9701466.1 SAV_915 family protein [Streptomyces sp. P17]
MASTETALGAPEVLVLPTMTEVPHGPDGAPISDGTVEVTLIPVADNGGKEQLVALAFTSVPLLVEAMGQQQPWVILPVDKVGQTLKGSGAEAILIDPQLTDGMELNSSSG